MKRSVVLSIFLIGILFFTQAYSQTNGWSFHFGKTMPVGSFARSSNAFLQNNIGEGAAKNGFGIGVKGQCSLRLPVLRRLKLIASIDIMYNGLNDGAKTMIETHNNPSDYFTASAPSYYNVPIMAGVNLYRSLFGAIKVYGEVGMGVNFRMVSDMDRVFMVESGEGGKEYFSGKINFDNTSTFAFQLGVGLCFFNRLSFALNYYNLGTAELKGSLESIESMNLLLESIGEEYREFTNGKVGASMFVMRLGWHF